MMISSKLYMLLLLFFINLINIYEGFLLRHKSIDDSNIDPETISFVNRLKIKLGIRQDDAEIDSKPFENTIINGKHFGQTYHESEKIRKYFEKTGILLNEEEFMILNDDENNSIVIVAKKSPYEKDNEILNHFEFNKNILMNTFIEGFFVVNLKNIKINRNTYYKYHIKIFQKNYNENSKDEIIASDSLDGLNDSTNKIRKIYIPENFLTKLRNKMVLDLSVYAKITFKNINNDSIFDVVLPATVKSLHLSLAKNNVRKKRSRHLECDPVKHGKSCCMVDAYINLRSFGELKNIAFPGIINARRCVGECVLNDNQSLNAYILNNFTNKTVKRQRCCRPTKFETVDFVLKKDNSTMVEISVNDLVVKACGCY